MKDIEQFEAIFMGIVMAGILLYLLAFILP